MSANAPELPKISAIRADRRAGGWVGMRGVALRVRLDGPIACTGACGPRGRAPDPVASGHGTDSGIELAAQPADAEAA